MSNFQRCDTVFLETKSKYFQTDSELTYLFIDLHFISRFTGLELLNHVKHNKIDRKKSIQTILEQRYQSLLWVSLRKLLFNK